MDECFILLENLSDSYSLLLQDYKLHRSCRAEQPPPVAGEVPDAPVRLYRDTNKRMDNDRSAMDYGEPKMTEGEIQYPMDNGAEIEAMAAALDEEDGNDCELCEGTGKDWKGKPCQECSVDYDADSAN